MKRKGQPITVELKKYTNADLEPRSFKDHNDLIVRIPSPKQPEVRPPTIKPPGPGKEPFIQPPGGFKQRPPRPDPVPPGNPVDDNKKPSIPPVQAPRPSTPDYTEPSGKEQTFEDVNR